MTIRWSMVAVESSYTGSVVIINKYGDIVDMKSHDSLVITDPSVNEVRIIAQGPFIPTLDVRGVDETKPSIFELLQNYPNPFNPKTVIRYSLSVNSLASLRIYDVLGREIARLVDGRQEAGWYTVSWDARNVPSGVYFYRLQAVSINNPGNRFIQVRKTVLLR